MGTINLSLQKRGFLNNRRDRKILKIKIKTKNGEEIKPEFNSEGFIINIKKYNYIHFNCELCGKEVRKSSDAFRDSGYPYNPVFDYRNAEFICKGCSIKKTTRKKYNVSNISELDCVKEQKKKTMMKNYGNLHQNIINGRKTIKKRYGVKNVSQIGFVKEKKYNKKRQEFLKYKIPELEQIGYSFLEPSSFTKTRDEDSGKNIEYLFRCNKCGNEFSHNIHATTPRCNKCYPLNASIQEKELVCFIKSVYGGKVEENNRSAISPYEIDILLNNVAIEYNGIYWHSEEAGGKDRNYHIDKYNRIKDAGFYPVFVFEDEWLFKKEIVKSILKNRLEVIDNKIYARKCFVKELKNDEIKDFYEINHIQGYAPSLVNLALIYNDEIVSALSFGSPRFAKKYDYEIIRFSNLLNTSVIGGFGKLFKHFTRNYEFNKIITYSDKRFFTGDIYLNNGFKQLRDTSPSYYYFNKREMIRYNRVKFQKHKLNNILENFDENLSEHQNMCNNNYLRIWDCGNHKFEFAKKNEIG